MNSIYDPRYKIFSATLKELRLQSHMTQQELATLLDCPQSYISKYEQGQKRLDIIELHRICNILGVSLSEFTKEYESKLKKEGL